MLHLRISVPTDLTAGVVGILERAPAVSSLAVLEGASVKPPGDVVLASVAREAANEVLDELHQHDAQREGTLHIEPVDTWVSRAGPRGRAAGAGQQRGRGRVDRRSRTARTRSRS